MDTLLSVLVLCAMSLLLFVCMSFCIFRQCRPPTWVVSGMQNFIGLLGVLQVFLHEGLGSISHWKDVPKKVVFP